MRFFCRNIKFIVCLLILVETTARAQNRQPKLAYLSPTLLNDALVGSQRSVRVNVGTRLFRHYRNNSPTSSQKVASEYMFLAGDALFLGGNNGIGLTTGAYIEQESSLIDIDNINLGFIGSTVPIGRDISYNSIRGKIQLGGILMGENYGFSMGVGLGFNQNSLKENGVVFLDQLNSTNSNIGSSFDGFNGKFIDNNHSSVLSVGLAGHFSGVMLGASIDNIARDGKDIYGNSVKLPKLYRMQLAFGTLRTSSLGLTIGMNADAYSRERGRVNVFTGVSLEKIGIGVEYGLQKNFNSNQSDLPFSELTIYTSYINRKIINTNPACPPKNGAKNPTGIDDTKRFDIGFFITLPIANPYDLMSKQYGIKLRLFINSNTPLFQENMSRKASPFPI
jgi:hypothetical protein